MKTFPLSNKAYILVKNHDVVELPARINRHTNDNGWLVDNNPNAGEKTVYFSDNDYQGSAWESLRTAFKFWIKTCKYPLRKGGRVVTEEHIDKSFKTGTVGVSLTDKGYRVQMCQRYIEGEIPTLTKAKRLRREMEKEYISIWGYDWQRYSEVLNVKVSRKFKEYWS